MDKIKEIKKNIDDTNRKLNKLFEKYDGLLEKVYKDRGKMELLEKISLNNQLKINGKADKKETQNKIKLLWTYLLSGAGIFAIIITILMLFVIIWGGW